MLCQILERAWANPSLSPLVTAKCKISTWLRLTHRNLIVDAARSPLRSTAAQARPNPTVRCSPASLASLAIPTSWQRHSWTKWPQICKSLAIRIAPCKTGLKMDSACVSTTSKSVRHILSASSPRCQSATARRPLRWSQSVLRTPVKTSVIRVRNAPQRVQTPRLLLPRQQWNFQLQWRHLGPLLQQEPSLHRAQRRKRPTMQMQSRSLKVREVVKTV